MCAQDLRLELSRTDPLRISAKYKYVVLCARAPPSFCDTELRETRVPYSSLQTHPEPLAHFPAPRSCQNSACTRNCAVETRTCEVQHVNSARLTCEDPKNPDRRSRSRKKSPDYTTQRMKCAVQEESFEPTHRQRQSTCGLAENFDDPMAPKRNLKTL